MSLLNQDLLRCIRRERMRAQAVKAAAKKGGLTERAMRKVLCRKAPQALTDYFIERITKSGE